MSDDARRAFGHDPLLRWFEFAHLKPELQVYSKRFADLAHFLVQELQPTPERTVALRKLLEAKDAAVRAKIESDEVKDRGG